MPVSKANAEPVGPLTSALSKIKTNVPSAYRPLGKPTTLYPVAEPVSSLGAQFQGTSRTEIGPAVMPPPPQPPNIITTAADKKTADSAAIAPLASLMPPPLPPSNNHFTLLFNFLLLI